MTAKISRASIVNGLGRLSVDAADGQSLYITASSRIEKLIRRLDVRCDQTR